MNKKEFSAIVVVVCLLLMGVIISGVMIKHALTPSPSHSNHATSDQALPAEDFSPLEYVAPAPPAEPSLPAEPIEDPQPLPNGKCAPVILFNC